jgi:hypothetical protein
VNLETTIAEMRTRLAFARGSPSLLLAVCPNDSTMEETRRILRDVLRATPLTIVDLGVVAGDAGPARWAEMTRAGEGEAFLLTFATPERLGVLSFARLLNAERQLLRDLAGPLVLLVSRRSEQVLRKEAQDFITWVATSYELGEPRELREYATRLGVSVTLASAEIAEEPIRFLHISDLHLRPPPTRRHDQDRVLDGLLALLERDRPTFPLDLIFVTGDLAQSGRPEEYTLIKDLFSRIMTATGVPPERVFVVPGNHDVDRGVGRWLKRTLSGDDEAVSFFVEPESRAFHVQKMAAYASAMREVLGASRPLGLQVGAEAVEVVELKGVRLAVASFNSAWFAQGDDDRGQLWLGEPSVRVALERIADLEAEFAVALFHHPLEDLNPEDRERVEPLLERGFEMLLRGHLHAARTGAYISPRGGYVEQAAPAAYQGSKWANGCFLGEIRARARTVRIRPYAFASGADPWVLDTRVFPDDEKDGYCHTFIVPAKRREKSSRSRALRAAAVEAIKAASAEQRQELRDQVVAEGEPVSGERADSVAADMLVESPDALRNFLGSAPGAELLAAVDAITRSGQADATRIEITDRKTLKEAILRAGRLFLRGAGSRRWPTREAVVMFGSALDSVIDGGVIEAGGSLYLGAILLAPDILLKDRLGSPYCVVEMKMRRRTVSDERGDLKRVDDYLDKHDVRFGVVVYLQALPASESRGEPQLDESSHPEVMVLRL